MKCLSCYTPAAKIFCPACRRQLFDGRKIDCDLEIRAQVLLPEYLIFVDQRKLVCTNDHGSYLLRSAASQSFNQIHAPENEHVTTQIAKRIFGIQTYPNTLIYFNQQQTGFLSRRQCNNNSRRANSQIIHLEGDCRDIKCTIDKYVSARIVMLERVFNLIIFNYLTCNCQLVSACVSLEKCVYGDFIISPAENLLNTRIHTEILSSEPAMNKSYLVDIGHQLGLPDNRINKIIERAAKRSRYILAMINNSFMDDAIKKEYLDNCCIRLSELQNG